MAVLPTLQVGDPRLKEKNQHVLNIEDSSIQQIITDLIDTMHDGNLIGMAAPQLGYNYQIYVTHPRETEARPKDQSDDLRIYINPTIISTSQQEIEIWEACGCVAQAKLFAPVLRPRLITVKATDQSGQQFELTADGILGRVIQHEQDHLVGIEFTEKISDYSKLMSKESYIKLIKPLPTTRQNSLITIKEYKSC